MISNDPYELFTKICTHENNPLYGILTMLATPSHKIEFEYNFEVHEEVLPDSKAERWTASVSSSA